MQPSQEHAEHAALLTTQHPAQVSRLAAGPAEPASGSPYGAPVAELAAVAAELEAAAVLGVLVDELAREAGPHPEEAATGAGALPVEQAQLAQQQQGVG